MKLTRSVSYAVGILLQVQNGRPAVPMTAAQIATGCRFPPRFLYRVLRRLVEARLLVASSGPGGGYTLAKPPRSVTLLDIILAVESAPQATVLQPVRAKHRKSIARINRLCQQTTRRFTSELRKITLAKLSRK